MNVTRGHGLLESFLSTKRAAKANDLLREVNEERILDLGCGSYPYFLTHTNFRQKYGVDPSLKSLGFGSITLQRLDVTKPLPFKANFFNAITMLAVFEHIDFDKLNFVLGRARAMLKKDGIFVITTPSPWSDKLLHFMAIFGLISSEEIHDHKHHYNRREIENALHKAGFRRENIESGFFEFGMNMWFKAKK